MQTQKSQMPKFEELMQGIKEEVRCHNCDRLILNPYERELVAKQEVCVDCWHEIQDRREDRYDA